LHRTDLIVFPLTLQTEEGEKREHEERGGKGRAITTYYFYNLTTEVR